MPDLSYNKRQQKERPSIRQIAQEFLSEELQAQLEPFLRYIEEKKFPFSLARCNTYESKYKGRPVFRVEIALGQACVRDTYAVKVFTAADKTHFREQKAQRENNLEHYKEQIENNLECYLDNLALDMAEYYLAHQSYCRGCGKCRPGVTLAIRGKAYLSLCASDMYVMRVTNPSESDFEMIKRFIDARRQYISKS